MNEEKKVLAVVFSEEDLMRKMESLRTEGYTEQDIHLVAQDGDWLDSLEKRTGAEGEEVNSFKDKFKGFISGEGSVREGVKSLGLSEQETERYTADIARGGILLYTEAERPGILEAVEAGELRNNGGMENPEDRQRQQFINSVDNRFDEQEDRFARGETFMQDPSLVKDERHVSFTTQEKPDVEKARGGTSEAEKHSHSDSKYK
ncbi:general stress protein [Planococcus sp. CAU13]|uniref:general stress protein n=1 Tax=Planococcus sp. CAU13 TaxID=1541197 RepID=UPI00052FDF40|nr:general stress protein [Planococcus sp. CAU13]